MVGDAGFEPATCRHDRSPLELIANKKPPLLRMLLFKMVGDTGIEPVASAV